MPLPRLIPRAPAAGSLLALLAGGWLSMAAAAASAPPSHAVILMYHHFGVGEHPSTNIRIEQFEDHLEYLDTHDYRIWSLGRIIEHLRAGEPIPDRTVAITMDDAYRSVYTQAYPRLRERDWPFTVFVSTGYIDDGLRNYMTWEQMRRMQQHGASYGNHSRTHDYLVRSKAGETDEAWVRRVREDIRHAQQRLDAELDEVLRAFAYPFGEYSAPLAGIVDELGLVAFGQQSGPVGPHSDLKALPRFALNEHYGGMDEFRERVRSLPLPVTGVDPWDPRTRDEGRPRLEVSLAKTGGRFERLACYATGQGAIPVRWIEEGRRFEARAGRPLPQGRSRYNCTVPSGEPGRFHWYSHLWIR